MILRENARSEKNLPKGPSTTQYIGGIVADQLSKMAATIIGSMLMCIQNLVKFCSLVLKIF